MIVCARFILTQCCQNTYEFFCCKKLMNFYDLRLFVAKCVVRIYALFPQIFLEWKAKSADIFTFWMYDQGSANKRKLADRLKNLWTVKGAWPDQKKDNIKDKYKEKDNDKNKYIQRTPSESDPRDLWPLRHLISVMRGHDLTNNQNQGQWQRQIHLENTFREWPYRLVTFETFDQSDERTWPDKQKDNDIDKDKDNNKDNDKDNPGYLWHLRH